MASVSLEGVSKTYPDGVNALASLDLHVSDGELMVLVGPSGCGKTTALLIVAGLLKASEGSIRIGERVVTNLPPKDRDIAMVFQNYALYPHMTVFNNLAFGLKLRRTPRAEITRRVREIAAILELDESLSRKPASLSGGQRQRVAMGRAIVREPRVFLMDEPLSNLDAKLRVRMRAEISRIQSSVKVTTIYVTHDQTEAMTMGDRVAVMNAGQLQQVDTPQSLYGAPANLFVAGFIGSPAMNLFDGAVDRDNDGVFLVLQDIRVKLDDEILNDRPALMTYVGQRVTVGIRPEDLKDCTEHLDFPVDRRFPAVVDLTESLGSDLLVYFTPGWMIGETEVPGDGPSNRSGLEALQRRTEQAKRTMVARLTSDASVREGQKIELGVDVAKIHFFDPVSGEAVTGAAKRVSSK